MRRRPMLVAGLVAVAVTLAAAAEAYAAPGDNLKFVLEGSATRATSPTDAKDDVVKIDTTGGAIGDVYHVLNQTVHALDGRLSLDYFFVDRSCGGGAPRISLAVDTDGDGAYDTVADGFVGPAPNFTGCQPNAWRHEDLTDAAPHWDVRKVGVGLVLVAVPWSAVEAYFAAQPAEEVQFGVLADDAGGFFAAAAGVAYYDTVVMGPYVLERFSDVSSN
ncbi:MAG TPA: hypothetical protein VFB26_09895 [Gaiellaceae bacterium]|nr:hypothetical protein [Gaiellaceae bacterium]